MSAHSESPAAKQMTKSIREVLELLTKEFPDVTVSKIRFLESRGLIHPERNASGYRKFGEEDIERLRWILRQQRENFLPLKVIKGRLEQAGTTLFAQSLFEQVSEESVTVTSASNRSDGPFDEDDLNQDPDGPANSREDEDEFEASGAPEEVASDVDAADAAS
ncbi:MAG: MerR family transcriptional regulator, partial [Acidimicrobiales bacterium]